MDLFDNIQKIVSNREQNESTINTPTTITTKIKDEVKEIQNQEEAITEDKPPTANTEVIPESPSDNTPKEEIIKNNNLPVVVEAQEQEQSKEGSQEDTASFAAKITEAKTLLDNELITEEEFKEIKRKIIEKL